ncbi:hypothetical protein ACSQ67_018778 [Phaseolus vulgaris]
MFASTFLVLRSFLCSLAPSPPLYSVVAIQFTLLLFLVLSHTLFYTFISFQGMLSQFQEAFSSTDGRIKLVHSMEGIVKGSQQKLERVRVGLQEEERIRNDLKGRYAAAIGEQKRCYSLSKAFQVSFSFHPMTRLFGDFCVC